MSGSQADSKVKPINQEQMLDNNKLVLGKLAELYSDLFAHDGYGDIRVEMRILRRGQKEVILHCGKQYRYVVDYASTTS